MSDRSELRALPARPNLEYEHKRAKKLLREVSASQPDALERIDHARACGARVPRAADFRLAHTQLVIAREYGFAGWPQLVAYYQMWETHYRRGRGSTIHTRDHYEFQLAGFRRRHERGDPFVARVLATFVPRFYGLEASLILAQSVTTEELQLCVARMERAGSWQELLERGLVDAGAEAPSQPVFQEAWSAVMEFDSLRVAELVTAHPELIGLPDGPRDSLLRGAILLEEETRDPRAVAMTNLLVECGGDLRATLSVMLTHCLRADPKQVAFLLERGADPEWLPPNGVTILEHALLRYWNADAVDLISARVKHRDAFWINAGVGDVRGTLAYIEPGGSLTDAAHADRPDFIAIGLPAPRRPNATDSNVIWETFYIAGINHRMAVIDALLATGTVRIDDAPWGMSLMAFAEGNELAPLVAALADRGARSST